MNTKNVLKKKVYDQGFTVIDNNIFKNKNVSLRAKGLLSLMWSLPNNWSFTEMGLTVLSKDGITSVKNGLKELEEYGYLERNKVKDDTGKFKGWEYLITDNPRTSHRDIEKPLSVKPLSEKKHYKISNNKVSSNKTLNNNISAYGEIINYFNEKANTKFQPTAKQTIKLINARFNEGHTVDDFKQAIDNVVREWTGQVWTINGKKVEAEQYIRPSTVFNEKFENYLNLKNTKKTNSEINTEREEQERLEALYGRVR